LENGNNTYSSDAKKFERISNLMVILVPYSSTTGVIQSMRPSLCNSTPLNDNVCITNYIQMYGDLEKLIERLNTFSRFIYN